MIRLTDALQGVRRLGAARLRADSRLRTPDALQLAAAIESGCDAFLCNDFRGQPLKVGLTDKGCNLLVYGDNGSGKSSLYFGQP
jgi:ABC-type uncharacterized transport system fused permease/ATPase subunit